MKEMKILKTERLNKIKHSVILGLAGQLKMAGYRRQTMFRQRCIVPKITINDRSIINYLLDDAFPQLYFTEKNDVKNLDIQNCINSVGGKYILDLVKMSRIENYAHLFHDDFLTIWDEAAAKKKYGRADVIRFFIDLENEGFLPEFFKFKNSDVVNIGEEAVPNKFYDEIGLINKRPIWEVFDFTKIVKHKSPDIYKAFQRYAHRIYTLLGFGLWKKNPKALENCNEDDLLTAGNMLLDRFVRKKIFKTDRFSIERQIAFLDTEQEILESFQLVGKKYVPYLLTDIKTFINQLKSGISGILKNKYLDNPDRVNHVETFSQSDRKNIKKYLDKLGQYITEMEDIKDYHETQICGTYRKKVMFLYQQVRLIRKYFSAREAVIIYGLIGNLHLPLSFDEPLKNNDNGESFILYDILVDDKNVLPDEHLSWTTLFTDEFKGEPYLEKFLVCIPDHFNEYPPNYDDAGNFCMSYYSKKQLFSTFCSVTGKEESPELRKPFLESIQLIIENINKTRNDIRSKL